MGKRRGKKSQPVHQKKDDQNTIVLRKEDLPKVRKQHAPPIRFHANRTRDLRRGNRRQPKHRGGRDND